MNKIIKSMISSFRKILDRYDKEETNILKAFQAQSANFSEAIERLIILGETQGSITQCIQ